MNFQISKEKENLRNQIWDLIKENGISKRPQGDYGRIPNFKGAKIAAERLSRTIEWVNSEIIFCSPDSAQKHVRELALKHNKDLIMATPKIENGYLLIKGEFMENGEAKIASTIKGAFKYGESIFEIPHVDMVIEGSVAVDMKGNRLGKGGGYADKEISELINQKSINKQTPIATTIHHLQIVNKVPLEIHDKQINMIVNPNEVIRLFLDPNIALVK
jgi:5-formyltetrahydrofolate cyclo-ligase